jgi:hypothetical protein
MSSIVTAVPTGLIQEWCIQAPWFGPDRQECANATRGTTEAGFETICCDGEIVDTAKDLYHSGGGPINLADLICCRVQGPQMGGIGPIPTNAGTECSTGTPTPLASLAATNTVNVQGYLVTFTSASFGDGTTGDFIPTQTPYCLWAYTASGVSLTNITVPAAQITTLSTTDYLMGTVGTVGGTSAGGTSTTRSSSSTSHSAGQSSATNSASLSGSQVTMKTLCVFGLLWAGAVTLPSYL